MSGGENAKDTQMCNFELKLFLSFHSLAITMIRRLVNISEKNRERIKKLSGFLLLYEL